MTNRTRRDEEQQESLGTPDGTNSTSKTEHFEEMMGSTNSVAGAMVPVPTVRYGQRMLWLWSGMITVMPLVFALSTPLKTLPFAILFFSGIYLYSVDPVARACLRHARWPLMSMLAVTCYAIANAWGHGLGHRPLGLPLQTLVFLMIAATFSTCLHRRLVWGGFAVLGIFLGASAIVQCHWLKQPRAYGLNGGSWAAVEFGMFLLVLALMSLSNLLRADIRWRERWLYLAAVIVGLYGAVLSQSRGPVLSAIVVLGALGWINFARGRRGYLSGGKNWWWIGGVLLLFLALASFGSITARLDQVEGEVDAYAVGAKVDGAVSERLEMWRVSYQAFASHPMFGVGIGQFGEYVRDQVRQGQADPAIHKYNNAHSEYLEAAATGGVLGLVLLLLQFVVPLAYFARRALSVRDEYALAVARSGFCVVLMYSLCAFTNNVFYRAMPNSLYLFLVAGLAVYLASLVQRRKLSGKGRNGLD